jgi:ribonuclease HII
VVPIVAVVSEEAILLGVDENGLGSRLGPMTVTGVRVRVDRAKLRDRKATFRAVERAGIGDSKELCAHGSMKAIESRVLAMLEVHCGEKPRSLTEFAGLTTIESDAALRALCPEGVAPKICFDDAVPLPAFEGAIADEDRERAKALKDRGFVIEAVRISVQCAGRINDQKARGRSRMDVDLDAMLSLVQALAPKDALVEASLGKVGARAKYLEALSSRFALVRTECERRERSEYFVSSVGTLAFVMDGDATEPAISLASVFGKYARELWMHRHNRYWSSMVEGVTAVSGYHDPVTDRLVRATELVRHQQQVPDRCFER